MKTIREFVDTYPGDRDALVDALVMHVERLERTLRKMRDRDDVNGSLPPAYRTMIDNALDPAW